MTAGPIPTATPETQEFWDGTQQGELRIQSCAACRRSYFYPRPFCRYCSSENVIWQSASGRATLASFIINHRPLPVFDSKAPQIIALVDLEEGVRMLTNIVDVEPDIEMIKLGMPLLVRFIDRGHMRLPVFAPVQEVAA